MQKGGTSAALRKGELVTECSNGTTIAGNITFVDLVCSGEPELFILIGDSTLRNKYDFALGMPMGRKHTDVKPCQVAHCSTVCYFKVEHVSVDAIKRVARQFPTNNHAHVHIVLNFGLHQLHFFQENFSSIQHSISRVNSSLCSGIC